MGILLGYNAWGNTFFEDDSPSVRNIQYSEFSKSIVDEINVRQKVNQGAENVRDSWQSDTMFLAKFNGSLEAGYINNNGVKIAKFKILRRELNKNNDMYLGEIPYDGSNAEIEFIDSTQPNSQLVYTIVPIGENGLDGTPKEVEAESEFTGYWIVDKDTDEVLKFDTAIGDIGTVETSLNQPNRNVIETFSNYPQVYYRPNGEYHTFSLSSTFIPENNKRSGSIYSDILTKFIKQHKPFLVKSSNGELYVVDISNHKKSNPLNTWDGYDYITVTVDCMETSDITSYMGGN